MFTKLTGPHICAIATCIALTSSCQRGSGEATKAPTRDNLPQSAATVQSFDGWCFPANACTQEAMPIKSSRFDTCEETCVMNDPAQVQDMDATLYYVACEGDHGRRPTERMLFVRYTDGQGGEQALVLSKVGVEKLERCADKTAP